MFFYLAHKGYIDEGYDEQIFKLVTKNLDIQKESQKHII